MTDFWHSCGHHFLDRDESGGYVVTDDFLRVYLARPELIPPPDACSAERNLHAALIADPRRPVAALDIVEIADKDARENWEILIGFRDHLLRHRTLEAAYVDLIRRGVGRTPPLFINQLVHVILRNALDGVADALVELEADCRIDLVVLLFTTATQHDAGDAKLFTLDGRDESVGGALNIYGLPRVSQPVRIVDDADVAAL